MAETHFNSTTYFHGPGEMLMSCTPCSLSADDFIYVNNHLHHHHYTKCCRWTSGCSAARGFRRRLIELVAVSGRNSCHGRQETDSGGWPASVWSECIS